MSSDVYIDVLHPDLVPSYRKLEEARELPIPTHIEYREKVEDDYLHYSSIIEGETWKTIRITNLNNLQLLQEEGGRFRSTSGLEVAAYKLHEALEELLKFRYITEDLILTFEILWDALTRVVETAKTSFKLEHGDPEEIYEFLRGHMGWYCQGIRVD